LYETSLALLQKANEQTENESEPEQRLVDDEDEEDEEEEEEDEEEDEKEQEEEEQPTQQEPIESETESVPENSLIACPNCNRTFFPDRLTIHLKSCKSGKSMKKTTTKKAVYQPPKLKSKNSRKPQKDVNNSNGSSENELSEEKKVVIKPKRATKQKNMTYYGKFEDPDLTEDPALEYNTGKSKKSNRSPDKKGGTAMNTNTITAYSQLEQKEDNASAPQDIYGAPEEDNRVECNT
jgi:hypothetical protein